jgi:hypothetical protein
MIGLLSRLAMGEWDGGPTAEVVVGELDAFLIAEACRHQAERPHLPHRPSYQNEWRMLAAFFDALADGLAHARPPADDDAAAG